MNARRLLLVIVLAALCGCFRMNVRNGREPGYAPIEYDEKWHSGLIYGLAELSGPYDLALVCPNGWAAVHTETTFVNGLVDALTFNVYSPQTVTIRCAAR